MGLAQPVQRLTESEYLQIERAAGYKSEYFDGEMFAMAGNSEPHSLITASLISALFTRLKPRGCVVFDSNMRVKVESLVMYTYPDVSVACGQRKFADDARDTLLNPIVVFEVLSDSTEAYDRGKKFEFYRQIPALREYVLISQHEPKVEQFIRQPEEDWLWRVASGRQTSLALPSLRITLPLADIFAQVKFKPAPLRPTTPRSPR